MASYTIYKRYFGLAIFTLFLIAALIFAFFEFKDYEETKDKQSESLAKISLIAAAFLFFMILLQLFLINRLKNLSTKNRARIEGANRTFSGIRAVGNILRMK